MDFYIWTLECSNTKNGLFYKFFSHFSKIPMRQRTHIQLRSHYHPSHSRLCITTSMCIMFCQNMNKTEILLPFQKKETILTVIFIISLPFHFLNDSLGILKCKDFKILECCYDLRSKMCPKASCTHKWGFREETGSRVCGTHCWISPLMDLQWRRPGRKRQANEDMA